jgi:hypothetical protein
VLEWLVPIFYQIKPANFEELQKQLKIFNLQVDGLLTFETGTYILDQINLSKIKNGIEIDPEVEWDPIGFMKADKISAHDTVFLRY